MSSPLNVQLEQYEGPLDLLLDLIRKHKLDVRDIPIARITADYLAYVEKAIELDIELSAEFVYMAATLIQIKSRTLLPKDPELAEEGEAEDPRKELVERLIEYEKYKNAAEMLQQKRLIEENVWTHPSIAEFLTEQSPDLEVTLFDLVKTFRQILDRARQRPVYEVQGDDVSVPDMVRHLRSLFERMPANRGLAVIDIFEPVTSRRAIICLFLAILEMVRYQALLLTEKDSVLTLYRHVRFDEAPESAAEDPVAGEASARKGV